MINIHAIEENATGIRRSFITRPSYFQNNTLEANPTERDVTLNSADRTSSTLPKDDCQLAFSDDDNFHKSSHSNNSFVELPPTHSPKRSTDTSVHLPAPVNVNENLTDDPSLKRPSRNYDEAHQGNFTPNIHDFTVEELLSYFESKYMQTVQDKVQNKIVGTSSSVESSIPFSDNFTSNADEKNTDSTQDSLKYESYPKSALGNAMPAGYIYKPLDWSKKTLPIQTSDSIISLLTTKGDSVKSVIVNFDSRIGYPSASESDFTYQYTKPNSNSQSEKALHTNLEE